MPNSNDLDCARGFDHAADIVHSDGCSPEGVCLLAFYAAIRYANSSLFPMPVVTHTGQNATVKDIVDYKGQKKDPAGKHEIRHRLLEAQDRTAGGAFKQLWDAADAARYGLAVIPPQLAEMSVRLMGVVRDRCVPTPQATRTDEEAAPTGEE